MGDGATISDFEGPDESEAGTLRPWTRPTLNRIAAGSAEDAKGSGTDSLNPS